MDLLDQSPGERLGGVEGFAGHEDLARPAPTDEGRQKRGLNHRGKSQLDLRHAEHGGIGRQPQIARRGDLEASAEAPPVHGGDNGNRQIPYRLAATVDLQNEGPGRVWPSELGHLIDVRAANKRLVARAGQDHGAQFGVLTKSLEGPDELGHHRGRQVVELGGIVHAHPCRPAARARFNTDLDVVSH